MKKIYLAGGCFWGVDAFFKQARGITNVTSGYANGNIKNPTYEEVCNGVATHAEAVLITYDENIISLNEILDMYFRIIDPFSLNKQGNDIGLQYRTGIYYDDLKDEIVINNYINNLQKSFDQKIVVEVKPLLNYYLAEDYHQDYLKKNPKGYCHINLNLIKKDERK